jgi:hypothetical protein
LDKIASIQTPHFPYTNSTHTYTYT